MGLKIHIKGTLDSFSPLISCFNEYKFVSQVIVPSFFQLHEVNSFHLSSHTSFSCFLLSPGVKLEELIRAKAEREKTSSISGTLHPTQDSPEHSTPVSTESKLDPAPAQTNLADGTLPPGSQHTEELVLQLFELVNEKNALLRRQAELMYVRRQHQLEEEHAELEYQIRRLMLRPDRNKTDADKEREEQLIQR